MINFEIHKNILDLDDLNLESNMSSLTPEDKAKVDKVSVLEIKEKAYFQRDMISVVRNFLGFCMEEHTIYLILLEEYPQIKNRIRTKKGLFHSHKGQFQKDAIFETETTISPEETLFGGIIRVTDNNIDYLINKLDELPFAFGLISPKSNRPFKTNRKDFLETIVSEGLKPGKIYWKNWLKITSILTKPGRKFFTLQDLNDMEHLRVFYHKNDMHWSHQLKSFIAQELEIDPILQN